MESKLFTICYNIILIICNHYYYIIKFIKLIIYFLNNFFKLIQYAWSSEGRDANGIGRYVINGGARIEKLYAKVGQTLTAKVSSNEPVNMGTVEDPIGAIDIEVSFTSASVWNSATTTCTVKIMGNSKYDELSCKGNDP